LYKSSIRIEIIVRVYFFRPDGYNETNFIRITPSPVFFEV